MLGEQRGSAGDIIRKRQKNYAKQTEYTSKVL